MSYLKFNDWTSKVQEIQGRLNPYAIMDVKEVVSLPSGDTITIILKTNDIYVYKNGDNVFRLNNLRHDYTNAKKEFSLLLDALDESTTKIVDSSIQFYEVAMEKYIPEMTIERMKGNLVEEEPSIVLEKKATFLMKELRGMCCNTTVALDVFSLDINFLGKTLEFQHTRGDIRLGWGGCTISYGVYSSLSPKDSLDFIIFYPQITNKIRDIYKRIDNAFSNLRKED